MKKKRQRDGGRKFCKEKRGRRKEKVDERGNEEGGKKERRAGKERKR